MNSSTINSINLGMNTDSSNYNLQKGQYSFALNAGLEDFNGEGFPSIQNSPSNFLAVNFPTGFKVVGKRYIPEFKRTIFMLHNPTTGLDEIGEVKECNFDSATDLKDFTICGDCVMEVNKEQTPLEQTTQTPYCTYRTIVSSDCLNFDLNHPVDIEYRKVNNSLYIYYVDDKNPLRFTYFDLTADALFLQNRFKIVTGFNPDNCNLPIYSNQLDCNKIRYNPNYTKPEVTNMQDIPGGTIKAGSVQVLIAYADFLGNPLTPYFVQGSPYPIKTRNITIETNYETGRALYFDIENLEQSSVFDYYNVVVAETVDNFTTFKLVGTVPISTNSFTYTGDNQLIKKLTESEVFFKSPIFEKAASVTKANDYLFFARLKEYKKLNLQRAINRIKPYWQTVALKEEDLRKPENVSKYRGYMRDEVYPLGLVVEFTDDNDSVVFPLIGPSKDQFPESIDFIVTNDDVINRDICETNCCEPSSNTGVIEQGIQLTVSCNDNDCEEQGATVLSFVFPEPTVQELHLLFGEVIQVGSTKKRTGDNIMSTIPAGTIANDYYDVTGRPQGHKIPFEIIIPAGTTTFTTSDIIYQQNLSGGLYAGWICHSCLFPITDLYIKLAEPTNVHLDIEIVNDDIVLHTAQNIYTPPVDVPDDCVDCNSAKYWQTYNTGFVIDDPHEMIDGCGEENIWEFGEFAYWESTEKYPNNPDIWGDLCGKPIRHFKFPDSSVTHIHDGLNDDKVFNDNNIIYPIGIRLDHQSVIDAFDWAVTNNLITAEDRARIKSYRLVRGNRFGNKSIRGKGLLYDSWSYDKYDKTYYFPNYPYNDLRDDQFLAPNSDTYDEANDQAGNPMEFEKTGRYTFHSPDVHFTNTDLGTELKLETEEYGQSEGYFNLCDEQPKYKFLSTASYTLAFAFGLASALSNLEEKECREYSVKSDYVSDQDDSRVSQASFNSGIIMAGMVTSTNIGGNIGNHNISNPDITESHNNQEFTPFRVSDGSEVGLPINVDTVTYKTCKGSTYQVLNSNGEIGGIGGFFGDVINILTGTTINGIFYRTFVGLTEMKIMLDLFEALIPEKNYSIQYNSVGKYNNYKTIANNQGIKIRDLITAEYLDPYNLSIQEGDGTTTYFNNLMRERSVYLRTNPEKDLLPDPTVIDNSKTTMDEVGLDYTDLNKRFNRTISSYYGSIKNYVPNQYGTIYNINYIETGSDSIDIVTGSSETMFGGDTFINRFALKRKHPFYIQTRFGQLDNADVQYQFLGNAAYPNYYFNTKQPLLERLGELDIGDIFSSPSSFLQNVLNVPKTRLDARQETSFFYQKGYIHLYNYGIPYFLVESDVNVDFRHAEDIKDKDYYPRQKDLDYWLQEKNVPISYDNTYFYNTSYSKQNKESALQTIKSNTRFGDNLNDDSNLLIYTQRAKTLTETDNWRIILNDSWYKADSFYGAIISADGIESDKVLIRCENGSQIFGAYDVLSTENGQTQIGTGRLFDSRPKEFAVTSLGYFGSQNRDIQSTEFGHVFTDAKRGNIFLLANGAQGIEELAKNGMKNWFKNNLPFFLKKDFPNLSITDLDNNYKGLGLTLCFDRRFNRLFLTKHDYRVKNPNVVYLAGEFYLPNQTAPLSLSDTQYFDNKSWTISYNFQTQTWESFHSFIPNYYVDYIDYFQSGINTPTPSSLWSHNVSNKSYQVFYGNLAPFIIDTPSQFTVTTNNINSIEYICEVLRHQNEYDCYYNNNVTFNKAIVYNNVQNSGLLNLYPKDENDMSQDLPKLSKEGVDIRVTNAEGAWRFNDFFDATTSKYNNMPLWLYDKNNVNKQLNKAALNYYKKDSNQPIIRGRLCNVRLINDKWSNYKFIYLLTQFNQTQSFK